MPVSAMYPATRAPVFLLGGQPAFSFADTRKLSDYCLALLLGPPMSDDSKTKPEKPEARPTDDGYLTPSPRKEKLVEPAVSRAPHFS